MDDSFRQQVAGGQPVTGMFVKSTCPQNVEILGHASIGFAVLDAEHAPLGLETLDRQILAARATRLPCLVRIPALHRALAGQVLDMGAAGIVVPHVASAQDAQAAVAEVRYKDGRRGYSPSTRAGDYGFGDSATHAQRADRGVSLWAQIEDGPALDCLDAIAATPGVDLLFIGRADLMVSLGLDRQSNPRIAEAVRAVADAARRHGKVAGTYVGSMDEAAALRAQGVSVLACGSDQSHLAAAAGALAAR